MVAVYYINNDKYKVTTTVSIDRNYKDVLKIVQVDELYKARMKSAKVRYSVKKNGVEVGCMYLEEDKYQTNAVTIVGRDIWAMMMIWYHIWRDTSVRKIRVVPHRPEDVRMYISIATGASLRNYNSGHKDYVVVDVDALRVKMSKVIESIV